VTGKNAVEAVMAVLEEVVRRVLNTHSSITPYTSLVGPGGGTSTVDARRWIVFAVVLS
jgi:hypothetical protein